MSYAIDLTLIHSQFKRGDITVLLTWLFEGTDRTTAQPCMVLTRTHDRLDRITQPCVITLDQSWRWARELWSEMDVMHRAQGFAESLGFNGASFDNVTTIITVVEDHLQDLLTMPMAPKVAKKVEAELTVVNRDSGETMQAEVMTR